MSLIRLGYLKSFESCFGKSGIIPFLQSFRTLKEFMDLWPRFRDFVFEFLRQTQHWDSLRESSGIILLLQVASHSLDFGVAALLLDNGISVHQRADGSSALESLVSYPEIHPDRIGWYDGRERMLELLLRHSDETQINEVSPDGSGLALIHLPGPWNPEWIVKKLANYGANVNLRVGKAPFSPASLFHLEQGRTEHAKALIKHGADPTLTDETGFDTVLVAALREGVSMLTDIYNDVRHGAKKDWHNNMDWCRKGRVHVSIGSSLQICTGMNALHLGALCSSTDVLRFYNDRKLIEDLDLRSHEGYSPLHFAASEGHVSNIKYLSACGCDVDARADDGSSPLHIAARRNDEEIVRALIKAGSKPFADLAGMTPTMYANQAGNKKLGALLDSVQSVSSVAGDESQQTGAGLRRLLDKTRARAFKDAVQEDDLALCKFLHAKWLRSRDFSE